MLKKLKEKRAKLLREAEALKTRDGSFSTDENRSAFDAKVSAIDAIDEQIRERQAEPSETPASDA